MSAKFAVFSLPNSHGEKEAARPPKDIFEAAEHGNVAFITRLIDHSLDFDVNQRDSLQRTALHWAAEMGEIEAARTLIEYGVDIHAVECNGRTAVHLAARSANADMLQALLEPLSPADKEKMVNCTDNFGITPVFLTLQKGDEGRAAFEVLMTNGGRYNDAK